MVEKFLEFLAFTHRFQGVRRKILANGEEREENDSEHSFQLALAAWYVIESNHLGLDTRRVLEYALVHDLVEVHAGDTFAHDKDDTVHQSKEQREREAAIRLKEELADFPGMHEAIAGYEARSDEEAKFVYALDKVLPPANVYLDGGKSWEVYEVTLDMIREHKKDKVKVSPPIGALWQELFGLIEKHQKELFKK